VEFDCTRVIGRTLIGRVTIMPRLRARKAEKVTLGAWEKEAKRRFPPEKGWIRQSKGYPDLVYFNNNTKEAVFVEVKSEGHSFHKSQKQMLQILSKARRRKALLVTCRGTKILSEQNALQAEGKGWEGIRIINQLPGI